MIYKLFTKGNKDCICRVEALDYFQQHFICKPLPEPWGPPPFTIARKHRPVRDFVGWDLCVPVLSARALSILAPLINNHCQVLPFAEIKKVKLFCINVLTCFQKLADLPEPPPPIFKIIEFDGCVYVNNQFVRLVMEHKLYGAGFTRDLTEPSYVFDPEVSNLDHWIHSPPEKT